MTQQFLDGDFSWLDKLLLPPLPHICSESHICNILVNSPKVTHPHGHSFDAVVHLKRQLDAQDPFLIFEINGEGMNEENPSCFFG